MLKRKLYTRVFVVFMALLLSLPMSVASAQTNTSSSNDLSIAQLVMGCLCLAVVFAFWGGVAFWIYNDANARGANGLMWVIIIGGLGFIGMCGTLFIPLLGLCCNIPGLMGIAGYFFTRPNYATQQQTYPPTGPSW